MIERFCLEKGETRPGVAAKSICGCLASEWISYAAIAFHCQGHGICYLLSIHWSQQQAINGKK